MIIVWDRWQPPTSILFGKKKKKIIIDPHDYFRLCAHPIKISFDRFVLALVLLSWFVFLKVSRYEIQIKNCWTLRDIDRRFRNIKQYTDHRSNSDNSSKIHDFYLFYTVLSVDESLFWEINFFYYQNGFIEISIFRIIFYIF